MRSFCVITSVASISSCSQLLIPAVCLLTARAYVLIPWIFLLFSQLLSTCFNFWGYLTVADLHKFLCSCWFAGYPGSTSCSLYLLFCLLVAPPIHSFSPYLSLQSFSYIYPVEVTSQFSDPGEVELWVNVLLNPEIQVDGIHVPGVADGHSCIGIVIHY